MKRVLEFEELGNVHLISHNLGTLGAPPEHVLHQIFNVLVNVLVPFVQELLEQARVSELRRAKRIVSLKPSFARFFPLTTHRVEAEENEEAVQIVHPPLPERSPRHAPPAISFNPQSHL